MMSYQKLDAWKSCNALLMAIADALGHYRGPEKKLIGRLFYTALRATGRIAFGNATGNRKMFLYAVSQAAGFVSECQSHLSLARVMGVLPLPACDQCDALRGRASFYLGQLFESLLAPPPGRERGKGG